MEDDSKEKAREICEKYQLPSSLMQNMWVAFVLEAVSCLERDGTIFLYFQWSFFRFNTQKRFDCF